uniref:Secreted protein n=1 Tax=Ditylenchus dipsaci TaxID=166011 RepID=A0A915EE55_9BILA
MLLGLYIWLALRQWRRRRRLYTTSFLPTRCRKDQVECLGLFLNSIFHQSHNLRHLQPVLHGHPTNGRPCWRSDMATLSARLRAELPT